jgi:hypothetical protein
MLPEIPCKHASRSQCSGLVLGTILVRIVVKTEDSAIEVLVRSAYGDKPQVMNVSGHAGSVSGHAGSVANSVVDIDVPEHHVGVARLLC